jgi:glycosyltransferase involved in cell wall biosynthesis
LARGVAQAHSMSERPLVSVGLPTYNGERFIAATLESLLAQTYAPIEIVVSDNASTDRTGEIVRAYAARDARIRYCRVPENRGAIYNFNRVVELAAGAYFMWAGDHDLWDPTYIEKCVKVLERDPGVALVYARTRYIDEEGATLIERSPDYRDDSAYRDARGERRRRYLGTIWQLNACNMFHGVVRLADLRRTHLLQGLWCADNLLVAELAMLGPFIQVEETLFFRRRNRPPESPEEWKSRVLRLMDPKTATANEARTNPALYGELRDAHLELLRTTPVGGWWAQRHAELATVFCFFCRFRVPITRWHLLDRVLAVVLYRLRLRRLFE